MALLGLAVGLVSCFRVDLVRLKMFQSKNRAVLETVITYN